MNKKAKFQMKQTKSPISYWHNFTCSSKIYSHPIIIKAEVEQDKCQGWAISDSDRIKMNPIGFQIIRIGKNPSDSNLDIKFDLIKSDPKQLGSDLNMMKFRINSYLDRSD